MKIPFNVAVAALSALVICNPHAAHAASLQAFAGVVAGEGTASIQNGCTTWGPPAELAFFGTLPAGLQALGGNATCGYSGGWTNPTSSGSTTPLTNSASLPPTVYGSGAGFVEYYDGTAHSRASYGSLGAAAHGNISGTLGDSPTAITASVGAATFSDTLTAMVSPTYTDVSSNGFVRYRFLIEGNLSTPGVPAAYLPNDALADFRIQNDGGPIYDGLIAQTYIGGTGTVSGAAAAGGGWTVGTGSVSGSGTFVSDLFPIDLLKSWNFEAGLLVNAIWTADAN
jgi:hypothetical protein